MTFSVSLLRHKVGGAHVAAGDLDRLVPGLAHDVMKLGSGGGSGEPGAQAVARVAASWAEGTQADEQGMVGVAGDRVLEPATQRGWDAPVRIVGEPDRDCLPSPVETNQHRHQGQAPHPAGRPFPFRQLPGRRPAPTTSLVDRA